MHATIDKKAGTITVTLPLAAPGTISKSGKSTIVATTGGNKTVAIDGKAVTIGLNAYTGR